MEKRIITYDMEYLWDRKELLTCTEL